ncbi:MAG: YtfJ family protein [Smithellaceae bacterium]
MKKIFAVVMVFLFCSVLNVFAAELKVGDKASDFSLKDSTGTAYGLETPPYKGKVVSVFYVDPDEKDMNSHVEDAFIKDPAIERNVKYKGLGIANLKDSKLPNFVIKAAVKSKQKKTGAIVLLDPDYTLLNLWGLKNDTSNIVILDKNRICRYIYSGKLPAAEVQKAVNIVKEYQNK